MTKGYSLLAKAFALCMGIPLLYMGVTMMGSDLLRDVVELSRSHALAAGSHEGLALGPMFALVGVSFLWPLRPFQSE